MIITNIYFWKDYLAALKISLAEILTQEQNYVLLKRNMLLYSTVII